MPTENPESFFAISRAACRRHDALKRAARPMFIRPTRRAILVAEPMVHLPHNESDDLQFLDLAERAINGEAALVSAEFLHLVKIDAWFGDRWYSFTGKALGALGVRNPERLRVPPFHPHRVVCETRYQLTDPPVPVPFAEPLHTLRSSEENFFHTFGGFRRIGGSACGAWYSGNSAATGRGSIMVYSATPHGTIGWYAGLQRRHAWELVKSVGIDCRRRLTLLSSQSAAR